MSGPCEVTLSSNLCSYFFFSLLFIYLFILAVGCFYGVGMGGVRKHFSGGWPYSNSSFSSLDFEHTMHIHLAFKLPGLGPSHTAM